MSIEVHIKDLTPMDVLDLRSQIVLGSIYLREYENDLGVDPKEVFNFFDGYIEYLEEIAEEYNTPTKPTYLDLDSPSRLEMWFNIYQ